MNKSQTIHLFDKLKNHKFFISKSVMVFIVLILLLLGGWNHIVKTTFYNVFIENYSFVSGKLSVYLSHCKTIHIVCFDQQTMCIIFL